MYSLYRNNHDQTFQDKSAAFGISGVTRLMSGWGTKFFDYDNDGNVDLFLANGHPDDHVEQYSAGVTYKERCCSFTIPAKVLKM